MSTFTAPLNISQELRDFIIKITATCGCTHNLPLYIDLDPSLRKNPSYERFHSCKKLYNLTNTSSISRLDLITLLQNYFNSQKLNNNRNHIIIPNEDIKKLFKLTDTDELTASNMRVDKDGRSNYQVCLEQHILGFI